jgi:5'-nucleotidase
MPYNLSKLLVVGISSRALFDLNEEDRIFRTEGLQAFIDYQRMHENEVLRPGSGFPLVKGLLGLNGGPGGRKVEVILLSKNHPDVSLRVFNSIEQHGLDITRAALTGGAPLGPYLAAFEVGLFLSQAVEDVQAAANQRVAAGLIYAPPAELQAFPKRIQIAFDGDCVIFSDEAQKVFDERGLEAFYKYEQENARKELPAGPFAKLLKTLAEIQGIDPGSSPVRIALVTDRNSPAHERIIRTLRAWKKVLKAFGADMFFDDKEEYCERAAEQVPTGRVLMPTQRMAEHIQVRVNVTSDNAAGESEFLLMCKTYLRRGFPQHEPELKDWYQLNLGSWPDTNRSDFLGELKASVAGIPSGNQRAAAAESDQPIAKLLTFLDNLALKYKRT